MTSTQVKLWMGENWWQLGLLVVLLATAASALKGAVATLDAKADKVEVNALRRDVRAVLILVCKDHPGDSQCAELPR